MFVAIQNYLYLYFNNNNANDSSPSMKMMSLPRLTIQHDMRSEQRITYIFIILIDILNWI